MPINFEYTGRTGSRVVKPEYLNLLLNEALQIITRAQNNAELPRMKTWFGEKNFSGGRNAQPTIGNKVTTMVNYLTNQTVEFISANQNTGGYGDLKEVEPRIYLGNWFSLKLYSHGERLVTIFHELSHKAIKTKDIGWDRHESGKAYKAAALDLASSAKYAEALDNAENWGYYLASYSQPAGLQTDARRADWSHMKSRNDIESKLAPSGNDARMTPAAEAVLGNEKWTEFTGRRAPGANQETLPCALYNNQHICKFSGAAQVPYVPGLVALT